MAHCGEKCRLEAGERPRWLIIDHIISVAPRPAEWKRSTGELRNSIANGTWNPLERRHGFPDLTDHFRHPIIFGTLS